MKNKAGLITLILFPFILWLNFEAFFLVILFSESMEFNFLHILTGIEFILPVCIILILISLCLKLFGIKTSKFVVVFISALIWIIASYLNKITKSYSSDFSYYAFRGKIVDEGVLTSHGKLVALTFASYQFTAIIMSLVIYLFLKKLGDKNEKLD